MQNRSFLAIMLSFLIVIILGSFVLAEDTGSFKGEGKIAFVSTRNGNEDIFVINDNGTGLLQLTDSELRDERPIWSPDGKKILYISSSWALFNITYELWVVDVDGSNRIKLADSIYSGSLPKWSADSSQILYVTKDEKKRIIMCVKADGSGKVALTNDDVKVSYLTWSPDGSKILYSADGKDGGGIYLMNSDGSEKITLIQSKGSYKEVRWSPRGDLIAYVYDSNKLFNWFGRKEGIYIITYTGSNNTWLAKGTDISWCPDGETIGFIDLKKHKSKGNTDSRGHADTKVTNIYTTYLVNVHGNTKPKTLVKTVNEKTFPYWSPDGLKVSYIERASVYVRVSGSPEKLYFKVPFAQATPRWSPDSSKMVAVGHAALFSKPSLFVVDFNDGSVYQLTDGTSDSAPVWSPSSK